MKKASFILGLIAGIVGIISCGLLLFMGLNMQVIQKDSGKVIIIAIIALLMQIVGLVFAVLVEKMKAVSGIIMIIACLADIAAALYSIPADSPVTFITCAVTAILFLISGIFAFIPDKK